MQKHEGGNYAIDKPFCYTTEYWLEILMIQTKHGMHDNVVKDL